MRTPRVQQARTADRKQQIIRAALRCFIELGFSESTMEEIRYRSGASTGSIYHHFKSKEELAAAVFLEGLISYQTGFLETIDKHTEAREGVTGVVLYHLGWVEAHPDWARYLFHMRRADFMTASEAGIKDQNRNFIKRVSAWLCPHLQSGAIRKMPEDLYPSLILGPCQEFAREWLAGSTRTGIHQAREQIAEAVWRSVKGEVDG